MTDHDDSRLGAMLDGHITTQLIAAAVRFGIPDLLTEAATEERLSAATGISPGRLRRFLSALSKIGLVEPIGEGHYRNTPMARHLLKETGALYGHALMAGNIYYEAWENLDSALLTGQSAFELSHGDSLWAYLDRDAETAAAFTRTQGWNTERLITEIIDLYPFPDSGVLADLGAGDGTLVAALLERFPGLRAIVFEQPAVLENTRRSLREHEVDERCTFSSGNFLEEVPEGGDLYMLKSVIHNWDDDSALRILRNCREAMADHSRLLLIERATDETDPVSSAVPDMTMLVLFGSRNRTVDDYERLLGRGGFAVSRTWSGSVGLRILQARPA
jgi:orsellinic acid C2-O-methyltransferase